jgi:hypothetical protein
LGVSNRTAYSAQQACAAIPRVNQGDILSDINA